MTPVAAGCQNPTAHTADTAAGLPWAAAARPEDKTRLARYIATHPAGVPLAKAVRDVFNDGRPGYLNTDYQLARRFVERREEVKSARQGDSVWVEPTPALFTCTAGKQRLGTQEGGGVEDTTTDEDRKWARDRARARSEKVRQVQTGTGKRELFAELLTERGSTEGTVVVQERVRGSGSDYNTVPHATRFNATSRARRIQRQYEAAWERASARYDRGVVVTLTTDPKRHESIAAAVQALGANFRKAVDWLAYSPAGADEPARPGRRLDYICVLEFTETAVPHLHVVFFGESWLVPTERLSRYWSEDCEQGEVVYLQSIRNRRGTWVPRNRVHTAGTDGGNDAGGTHVSLPDTRSIQSYLGKNITEVVAFTQEEVASYTTATHEGVRVHGREVVGAGGTTGTASGVPWKLALFWALNERFFTASESLQQSVTTGRASEGLPQVTCWQTVGAAGRDHVPASVMEAAWESRRDTAGAGRCERMGDRPPPNRPTSATGGD